MFSNKSKLKLKPIKDSSIGMLSRAPEPAGKELLPACTTFCHPAWVTKPRLVPGVLGGGMGITART